MEFIWVLIITFGNGGGITSEVIEFRDAVECENAKGILAETYHEDKVALFNGACVRKVISGLSSSASLREYTMLDSFSSFR